MMYNVIQPLVRLFCWRTIHIVFFYSVVASLCSVPCVDAIAAVNTQYPQKRIVIIGAGLAGLTCAYRLKQQAIRCDVYDARGRAGGRVWSARMHDTIVEIGGQNLNDGGAAENIRALINELGLSTIAYTRRPAKLLIYEGNSIDINQQLESFCWKPEELRILLEDLARSHDTMESILYALFPENEWLRIAYGVRLAAYEGAAPLYLGSSYITTLYHQLTGTLCAAHATIGDTSQAISFSQVEGGNARIIEMLMEHLQDDVHLNAPLCAVSRVENADEYRLTFLDGTSITADIVVLAIPASVLADIAIDDSIIDGERMATMGSIPYGTNGKVVYPAVAQQKHQCAMVTPRAILWYDEHIASITVAYVKEYGIFDTDKAAELIEPELALMRKFYLFPVDMDPIQKPYDVQFAQYNGPIAYSWANDPYAKGSYSYWGVGQKELFTRMTTYAAEQVKELFAPIDNSLFFAGEHTSILLDACGTLEGAVESGERTARMIVRCCH